MTTQTRRNLSDAQGARRLERIVKGFANHRRIQFLRLLESQDNLTLLELCKATHTDVKTASEHVRRLHVAGLVSKRSEGRCVRHALTELGRSVVDILKLLDPERPSRDA
jgi:DNA-binding MarR family transcriptional regulator